MFRTWRLTRYVVKELTGPTLLGLMLYTFVLLMNHFFLVAEKALSKNLGADLTLRLFAVGIPRLLVLSIPMAVLLGTLIAVGRLSADHEWTALQSAGQGPSVLLRPVLFIGLLGTLVGLVIYAVLVPRSSYAIRNISGELIFASNLATDLKPRGFYNLPENAVLFVDDIRPRTTERRLEGVLLIKADPGNQGATELILSRYGDLYPAPDGSARLILDLYQGVGHRYDSDKPEGYGRAAFAFSRRPLDLAPYLQGLLSPPNRVVQDLDPAELWREYKSSHAALERLPPDTPPQDSFMEERRARLATIELHQRVALPLTALVFAMLGLPLGITRVRSGKGAGFAMSLVVILVYWVTFTLARNQAIAGKIPAVLGPWAGNLILAPWVCFAMWRLRWTARGATLSPARLFARLVNRGMGGNAVAVEQRMMAELGNVTGTRRRFVGRLDRYLALNFLRVLAIAVASAILIDALLTLQNLAEGALRTQQPPSLMLAYYVYFVPGDLYLVLPISCLVAAVVAYTVLARTGELVAIRASGVSLVRATLPALVVTIGLCAFLFLVQDRIAPGASRKAQEVEDQIMGRPPRTYGLPTSGRWSFGPEGRRLYHYRLFDPNTRIFQGLSVFTIDRAAPRIMDHRFAREARWDGKTWILTHSWYRTFPDGAPVYEMHTEPIEAALDPPESFAARELNLGSGRDRSEQLSLEEIVEQIETLERRGYDVTRLRVSYHSKFAYALAPLVMVLLGLPFAFKIGRRGSLYAVGVALLLVLVYWATFSVFNALGLETVVPPYVAAWAPNLLFGLLGLYLMLFIKT